jgi:hypothetical protein
MSYTKYKNIKMVVDTFGVKAISRDLFPKDIKEFKPSNWLLETLEITKKLKFYSESERSHRLVHPILSELSGMSDYDLMIYAGRELNVDIKIGLNGECDFMLSFGSLMDIVDVPIFNVVEAKRQDIEYGSAQCAAQLIGAKRYNHNDGVEVPFLYGCSSTGDVWRFLKYENNMIILDSNRYYSENLEELLGVLQYIVDDCRKNLPQKA